MRQFCAEIVSHVCELCSARFCLQENERATSLQPIHIIITYFIIFVIILLPTIVIIGDRVVCVIN